MKVFVQTCLCGKKLVILNNAVIEYPSPLKPLLWRDHKKKEGFHIPLEEAKRLQKMKPDIIKMD